MPSLFYRNRQTGLVEEERIYGASVLQMLYGDGFFARWIGTPLSHLIAYSPWVSALYGWWQKQAWSRRKIAGFMQRYAVKAEECAVNPEEFTSFNAFFTRRLKLDARPIAAEEETAIIPADGRYRFYPSLDKATLFGIKGSSFNLATLIQDPDLAERYVQGTLVIARLCPSDYHRFHFPCDCRPGIAEPMNGPLYSVNPLALWRRPSILWENKRVLTVLESPCFGSILYIEVGATNVGTIHQTFIPDQLYEKGDEKGYFSFGGSTLLLLFEKGQIQLDSDLIEAAKRDEEMLCLMGQSLGRSNRSTDFYE